MASYQIICGYTNSQSDFKKQLYSLINQYYALYGLTLTVNSIYFSNSLAQNNDHIINPKQITQPTPPAKPAPPVQPTPAKPSPPVQPTPPAKPSPPVQPTPPAKPSPPGNECSSTNCSYMENPAVTIVLSANMSTLDGRGTSTSMNRFANDLLKLGAQNILLTQLNSSVAIPTKK